jgi:4-amino-4-deoxy-L-arabinose transferase-like glycosyltransferase
MRPSVAGLAGVMAVALALRMWGLGHGLPITTGIDEPHIMGRVMRMMTTGDFNPHFYDYPGLYLYVQLVVACLRFLFGVVNGAWSSLAQAPANEFYLWGRAVTAVLGTATVYLVYLIGTRWGTRHALLAAGIIAVFPNHVRESHYVLTDVPMTFLTTLAFLLTLRALEKRTAGAFAVAGAAAGLAAATKYYGGVVIVAPLFAACVVSGATRPRLQLVLAVVGSCCAAFLLGAPYTVLDLPGFLNGFAALSTSFGGGPPAEPAWLVYLKHVRLAIWLPGMLLLTWGTIHAIVRAITGPGKERFALLVLFPALYFALVASRTLVFARYLMPLFPFIALLIAIAIVSGVTLLRRFNLPRPARTALIVALTVVALLPAMITSIGFDRSLGRPSTAELAHQWMVANAPAGSSVLFEGPGFWLPPSRYEVQMVARLIDGDVEPCEAGKADYLVASEYVFGPYLNDAQNHPGEAAAYSRIFQRARLAASFRPSATTVGTQLRIYKCGPAREEPDAARSQTPAAEAATNRPKAP